MAAAAARVELADCTLCRQWTSITSDRGFSDSTLKVLDTAVQEFKDDPELAKAFWNTVFQQTCDGGESGPSREEDDQASPRPGLDWDADKSNVWLSWIARRMWPPNDFNEEMFSFATEPRRHDPTSDMAGFFQRYQCLCSVCSTMTVDAAGDVLDWIKLRAPEQKMSSIPLSEKNAGFAIERIASPFLCILSGLAACASLSTAAGRGLRGVAVSDSFDSALMASMDRAYLPPGCNEVSFQRDFAFSIWNESSRRAMFDHDCKRINETVRAAGGVLQALLAALDAESKTSVLDDMMCLVNYSFKSALTPSSYTAVILASSGLWAAAEALQLESTNTDLLVALYQACISHHSRTSKAAAWIILYLVLEAIESGDRSLTLQKHESFLQHMFKAEAIGLERLPFTCLCLAATSYSTVQCAEDTLRTLMDEAYKYSGDRVKVISVLAALPSILAQCGFKALQHSEQSLSLFTEWFQSKDMAITVLTARALLSFVQVTWIRVGLYSDRISTLIAQLEGEDMDCNAKDISLSVHLQRRQATLESLSQRVNDSLASVRESLELTKSTRLSIRMA